MSEMAIGPGVPHVPGQIAGNDNFRRNPLEYSSSSLSSSHCAADAENVGGGKRATAVEDTGRSGGKFSGGEEANMD
jgi:hypothetical protein